MSDGCAVEYAKILDLDQDEPTTKLVRHGDPLTAAEAQSLVETTARSVATKHKRAADLDLRLQPCLPGIDRDVLAVLVEELVENACGFSRQGTPVVVGFFAEKAGTTLRISDQGRGMAQEQINRLGAFMQFDRKRYEQQGLGLGLSLVGRLLKRAGGTLSVQSVMGEGTTVSVHVPNA